MPKHEEMNDMVVNFNRKFPESYIEISYEITKYSHRDDIVKVYNMTVSHDEMKFDHFLQITWQELKELVAEQLNKEQL